MVVEQERFVVTKNGRVFVKTWDPPKRQSHEPILLLHDSLGCVGTWRDFPNKLAHRTSRKVIAYDRLGFGKSTARTELPSPRFIDEEAEVVLQVLDASKCVLFGYSVGGSMALSMAAQYPDRITSVISESAQVFVEDHTLKGIEIAQRKFKNPDAIEKLHRWHGDQAPVGARGGAPSPQCKVEWILRAWFDVWTAPNFRNWSLAPLLPGVICPTLIIHGDRDDYGTIAFPQTIKRLVGGPAKTLILENCGHIPHWEYEDTVLSEVAGFLGS